MIWSQNAERDCVADGFVKCGVRSTAKQSRLVTVLHEVLDVPHLMVDGQKVVGIYFSAHLYSGRHTIDIKNVKCY